MKRLMAIVLILLVVAMVVIPAPAVAGGNGGWIAAGVLGGFLLGSILGPHEVIVSGPVYYPPPPVYYPPAARWIPDHYETVCEIMYQRLRCYPVFIPGHWEYR